MINLLRIILEQGAIFSLVVTSVFLVSHVLDFDDISLEGSFVLGGAVCAFFLLGGMPNIFTLLFAAIAGALAGSITGLLHTKLRINNLMSGIVVATGLYSINLKLAGAHVSLAQAKNCINPAFSLWGMRAFPLILIPLSFGAILFISWFLKTEMGFIQRAVGDNPQMILSLGKNPHQHLIGGLMLAHALTAFAGALFAQYSGFFSINSGFGLLVIALAGLTLSEFLKWPFVLRIFVGSLAYPFVTALIFELQLDPVWNKLAIALSLVLLLSFQTRNKQRGIR